MDIGCAKLIDKALKALKQARFVVASACTTFVYIVLTLKVLKFIEIANIIKFVL